MKKNILNTSVIIGFLLILVTASFFINIVESSTTDTEVVKTDLQKKINEYERKLTEINAQKNTLSSQIEYMDTQIYITGLRMKETEDKIKETKKQVNVLGVRINSLDSSLDQLSRLLLERIAAGYRNRSLSLVDIVLDSNNSSKLINRLKYYQLAREQNQKSLLQVQEAKSNFQEQKDLREKKVEQLDELQSELQAQEQQVKAQQTAKEQLLTMTKNDEVTYQNLLEQAKTEYSSIQQITSGGGSESLLGNVSKGQRIATLISGQSCNSNGKHLHFIVQEGGSAINPFDKLKPVDSVNDSNGDVFNPSGSWDWPLSPTIYLHQGFGNTWFVRAYSWYPTHDGIDITGSSDYVSAVADGALYKGSYSGFNGCALSYVKLKHKDSNITTLYLHVYPY